MTTARNITMPRSDLTRWSSPRLIVRRAAVLGAGTMGSQIAALLASQGVLCDLLDLPMEGNKNKLAEEAKKRMLAAKLSPIYTPDALKLIRPGNFDDDLGRLSQADWVIEAVAENLEIKRTLWSKAAAHMKSDAIASTNTSGILISSIAEALPKHLQSRFFGTHFFNPPRYLKLLEIVPWTGSDQAVVEAISRFAEYVLGKGVVIAKDVPNFIGNRVGVYGLMITLQAMNEMGLEPDAIDDITGPAMGRPRSATFRTLDLVGLDVHLHVCENTIAYVTEKWEKDALAVPAYFREMVKRGWLGEKAGQGFYKRAQVGGETQIKVLDMKTFEYRDRKPLRTPSLAAIRDKEDPAERLKILVNANDVAGQFAWRILSKTLEFSVLKLGEVCDDISGIDRAMKWGFGWDMGPFEIWDALGVSAAVKRMQTDGLTVPEWIQKLAAEGRSFYQYDAAKGLLQATPESGYVAAPESQRSIPIQILKARRNVVMEKPGATIFNLGDGVAFLDFHSPKQAIGQDMLKVLEESSIQVQRDFRGLVISSHIRPNFCVGTNLFMILMAAQDQEWDEIDSFVKKFQYSLLKLKRLPFPVVTAPFGLTLGGGAEIALSADRVVASAESYIGLVETGSGLIPAGGGCKEMLIRALEGYPGGVMAFVKSEKGGPPRFVPDSDPSPAIARIFETIAMSKVSGSAVEAGSLGFLRSTDVTVPNTEHLLHVAKHTVIAMDEQGYRPPVTEGLPVLGAGIRSLIDLEIQHMVWSKYASDHDMKIAKKLSFVITGGNRPAGSLVTEEYYLDLEREAFLSLCGDAKTQARMKYILETGKPLRN